MRLLPKKKNKKIKVTAKEKLKEATFELLSEKDMHQFQQGILLKELMWLLDNLHIIIKQKMLLLWKLLMKQ